MSVTPTEDSPLRIFADLPDPRDPQTPLGARTEVVLLPKYWHKIITKHIADEREPWKEVFSREIREALADWAEQGGLPPEKGQLFDQALERLGEEIRQALSRPLALLYTRYYLRGASLRSWCLILPCGALAFVQEGTHSRPNKLASCYFSSHVFVRKNEERWLKTVIRLVWTYSRRVGNRLLPPSGDEVRIKLGKTGLKIEADFRFVTLEQWGFNTKAPDAPWSGRVPDWPEEKPTALGKRRSLWKR